MSHIIKNFNKKEPVYLKIFKSIEYDILHGKIQQSDTLPTENEMCLKYNVNRSSVREAIRSLEQAGFIKRLGKKMIINKLQVNDMARITSRALSLGHITFLEVWECLSITYPYAITLCIKDFDKNIFNLMVDKHNKLRDFHKTPQSNISDNKLNEDQASIIVSFTIDFFADIANMISNRILHSQINAFNSLIEASLWNIIFKAPTALERIIYAHNKILNAIKHGHTSYAKLWMSKHINDLKRGYEIAGIDLNTPIIEHNKIN